MLEDFILEQLQKVALEREKLSRSIESLSKDEQETERQINELMDMEDVGFELFSPRSDESSVKDQIDELQKHIDEIRYKETQMAEYIDNNRNE